MKIENAKKIEVWQFEDEGVLSYLLPEGLIWKNFDGYKSIKNKRHEALVRNYFAELEAKESESENVQKAMDNFISESSIQHQLTLSNDSEERIKSIVKNEIDSYLEKKFDTVKQVLFSSINQTNAKHTQYADSVNSQINSLQLVITKIEKLLKNITNEFTNSYGEKRMKVDPYYNEIESNENE